MLRKSIIALAAVAAIGAFSPSLALARGGGGGGHGGFGGGGFHGGGFGGGGFHGGGFGGGGFRGGGFAGMNGFRSGGFGARSFAMAPGTRFAAVQGHGVGHFGHRRGFRHFGRSFIGFGGPYDDDYYYDDYADAYPYGGSCYEVQHVHTRRGWRWRQVDVCS